jgi:hypothetical protein
MTLFVIEKFDESKDAFVPTGNVSVSKASLEKTLFLLNKNSPGPTRKIAEYKPTY